MHGVTRLQKGPLHASLHARPRITRRCSLRAPLRSAPEAARQLLDRARADRPDRRARHPHRIRAQHRRERDVPRTRRSRSPISARPARTSTRTARSRTSTFFRPPAAGAGPRNKDRGQRQGRPEASGGWLQGADDGGGEGQLRGSDDGSREPRAPPARGHRTFGQGPGRRGDRRQTREGVPAAIKASTEFEKLFDLKRAFAKTADEHIARRRRPSRTTAIIIILVAIAVGLGVALLLARRIQSGVARHPRPPHDAARALHDRPARRAERGHRRRPDDRVTPVTPELSPPVQRRDRRHRRGRRASARTPSAP